jgi:UDP-3-O-[3-hydroxymyristoyl] N-acetylglucosamine deacetylase
MPNMMLVQRTLREKARCRGIGLHCGTPITLELLPAPCDTGIVFVRTDLPGHPEVRACIENVADTTLATTLAVQTANGPAQVGTVEHILSAFAGLGVDNVRVLLDGPEVPILDGSAGPFVDLMTEAGLEAQRRPKRVLVIKKEVRQVEGNKVARVSPGRGMRINCSLDFDHPLISPTPYTFELTEAGFRREVARARTFGFMQDVEALQARGLARGGSLENALVIDEYRVLNPEGLRFPDEFVRHKVLDAIGDLSLFGMPVVGRIHLHRSGHALNTQLVRAVFSDPKSYEIVQPAAAHVASAAFDTRSLELFEAKKSIA